MEQEIVNQIAAHYSAILELIGEDPKREGLKDTPMRAAKALLHATAGYSQDINQLVNNAIFRNDGSKMVIVKDIEFYSMCEHHILPFFGHISIGYIPDGKILGLSKLARVVDKFARQLQVQERLTYQICREICRIIGAKGVIAYSSAGHLCMKMRGVEKQDSMTDVLDYCGVFENDATLRNEFLQAIGKK